MGMKIRETRAVLSEKVTQRLQNVKDSKVPIIEFRLSELTLGAEQVDQLVPDAQPRRLSEVLCKLDGGDQDELWSELRAFKPLKLDRHITGAVLKIRPTTVDDPVEILNATLKGITLSPQSLGRATIACTIQAPPPGEASHVLQRWLGSEIFCSIEVDQYGDQTELDDRAA